jgi:hypothetical protein
VSSPPARRKARARDARKRVSASAIVEVKINQDPYFEENLSRPVGSEQKASFLISPTLTREARTEIPAEVRLIRAVEVESEGPGFSTAEPGHIPPRPATSSLGREAK